MGQLGGAVEPTISSLIGAAEQGGALASKTLFAALYSELHRVAQRELARNGFAATLSTTTLLHQAYLDIAEREGPSFPDRAHFMAYAARVMRGLIIDHARSRQAQKRGGLFEITSLSSDVMFSDGATVSGRDSNRAIVLTSNSVAEPMISRPRPPRITSI